MAAVVLCALSLQAAQQWSWHGAEFDQYLPGESLSDYKGAVGGSWSVEQTTSAATNSVVRLGGLQCLSVSTPVASGLAFTAEKDSGSVAESWGLAHLRFPAVSYDTSSVWQPPFLSSDDRAAFLVGPGQTDGKPAFYGWTSSGWKELASSEVSAAYDTWYDVRTRFVVDGERLNVEYALAVDGQFVTLAERGVSPEKTLFICSGTGTAWNRVLLRGNGYVGGIGSHLKKGRVDLRVRTR